MPVTPIYQPLADRPMSIGCFVSGSGTNLVKILEYREKQLDRLGQSTFDVKVILTDNRSSKAEAIGAQFGIPVILNDIMEFYRARGHETKKDMSLRPDFDRSSLRLLDEYDLDFIVLAGYMSVVTDPLLDRFDGRMINVHPADLRVRDGQKRRYTGDRAVASAIRRGEPALRSSVHIVRRAVDYGEILAVSAPMPVVLPEGVTVEKLNDPESKALLRSIADEHQDRLKKYGDWVIFPRVVELVSQGRYGFDENGVLFCDDKPAPEGIEIFDNGNDT